MKRNRAVLLLVIFAITVQGSFSQPVSRAKTPYERLLVIQQEYQEALAGGDSAAIAEKSYLLGKRYNAIAEYAKARQWFLNALQLRAPSGPSLSIGKIYNYMVRSEVMQDNLDEAFEYEKKAFYNFSSACSTAALLSAYELRTYMHLTSWKALQEGKTLGFVPSLDTALYYQQQAVMLAEELGRVYNVASNYRWLGHVLFEKSKVDSSILYLKKAYAIFDNGDSSMVHNVVATATDIGLIYLKSKQLEEAKGWLERAYCRIDSSLTYLQTAGVDDAFVEYYKEIGDWEKAYAHKEKALVTTIQELKAYRENADEGIRLIYENEKKEAELREQQRGLELIRRNQAIQVRLNRVIALLLLGAVGAGVFYFRLSRKYRVISRENEELVKEQSHRIKNNLQSVSNLLNLEVLRLSDPEAIRVLEESMMRVQAVTQVHERLCEGSKLAEVELGAYIPDVVTNVLYSYGLEHIYVDYQLEDIWLHAEKAVPFGLILNELTTNSCKYALGLVKFPYLEIRIWQRGQELHLCFFDQGPGFEWEKKKGSFGLKLIELLCAQLKGSFTFDAEAGSRFTMKFKAELSKRQVGLPLTGSERLPGL